MSESWIETSLPKKIFFLRKVEKKTNGAKGEEGGPSRNIIFAVKCFMANMRQRTRNTAGVQERGFQLFMVIIPVYHN